jgi:thiamine pyrophosphokinase
MQKYIHKNILSEKKKFNLIVTNTKVSMKLIKRYWKLSKIKIFTDGASTRIYNKAINLKKYAPDIICGDMDSSENKILETFEKIVKLHFH